MRSQAVRGRLRCGARHSKRFLGVAIVAIASISPGVRAAVSPVRHATVMASAPSPSSGSGPTVDQRVVARRAIEQVYWDHRLWPSQNPGPKPPLSAVMPDSAIRAEVEDALKKSYALGTIWGRPITPEQLQAEMNRMVADTKNGRMLGELFAAVGNDPAMIAETLARPALADRLIRSAYAYDPRFHGELEGKAEVALAACGNPSCMKGLGGAYHETVWALRTAPDSRSPLDLDERTVTIDTQEWNGLLGRLARRVGGAPQAIALGKLGALEETPEAFVVTAVIAQTASTLTTATVEWKKTPFDTWWAAERATIDASAPVAGPSPLSVAVPTVPYTLAATDASGCIDDTWMPTSIGTDTPSPRHYHAAVWTGAEMVIWGGRNETTYFNTGARYDPATDTWTATSTGANVPPEAQRPAAVWTGTEVILWGGYNEATGFLNSGGRYNPATDTWATMSNDGGTLIGRSRHVSVWTGTELIVWGGDRLDNGYVYLNSGERYNPTTDTWTPTSMGANLPAARVEHTAVWTGSRMIVWGGMTSGPPEFNTGGLYDPVTDTWTPTSTGANVPDPRQAHSAVWTGSQMIVWGGYGGGAYLNSGGRYDPVTDTWLPTSTGTNVPASRFYTTAVWTGSQMIVWGGYGDRGYSNTGGRYDPVTDTWTPTSVGTNNPDPRYYHSGVWTGSELIVFSGITGDGYVNTGGRYCACPSAVTVYRDADGDGYGDASVTVSACGGTVPAGYVTNANDCDDTNGAIHPGAAETCNGVDDDCDGTIDNGGDALCDDGNPCTDNVCNGFAGCAATNNTAACDDGDACTQTDTCQAGVCTGSNPVVCGASDQCHDAGVCDPATGACSNPVKADGTACNDGNACTQSDSCQAGVCTGSNPVVCGASDQCHDAGVCDPATGACSNPSKADGTACNDGDACTQSDSCQAGVCTGSNPVVCGASDQCHDAGVCDPATGACSNPIKADGTACNDGDACTQSDSCQAGVCTGSNPVMCGASDQCHDAGVCDPATGACSNPVKADGTACNDGDACTQSDSCQAGVCTGSNPVVCGASDQCHDAGVCDPATGACSNPVKADGTACNDGDACTQSDRARPVSVPVPTRSCAVRATSATTRASATRRPASARTR